MRHRHLLLSAIGLIWLFTQGFDLNHTIIPRDEILSGGPPKDGIPALLKPVLVSHDQAGYLNAADTVIGVSINGKAHAYPVQILNWHEAVNDTVAGQPLVVTF